MQISLKNQLLQHSKNILLVLKKIGNDCTWFSRKFLLNWSRGGSLNPPLIQIGLRQIWSHQSYCNMEQTMVSTTSFIGHVKFLTFVQEIRLQNFGQESIELLTESLMCKALSKTPKAPFQKILNIFGKFYQINVLKKD